MIFASNNKGKIKEIKEIFNNYEILSLSDANIDIDVVEDGKTAYENAYKKARTIFDLTGIPTLADDSGLIFTELGDWPGVNTKRIASNYDFDEHERNKMLIEKGKELNNKEIQAICCLVYVDKDNVIEATGKMVGTIAEEEHPGNGFGFDRVFILPDGRYVSELTREEKNKISHRANASRLMKEKLDELNINNK
jgi:XTP/dITP diphosphohydrolase